VPGSDDISGDDISEPAEQGNFCELSSPMEQLTRQEPSRVRPFHQLATLTRSADPSATSRGQEVDAHQVPAEGLQGLSEQLSGLAVSDSATAAQSVSVNILFDIEARFPCTAAFITAEFALVLARNPTDGTYQRIGVAQVQKKDGEAFVKDAVKTEVVIL